MISNPNESSKFDSQKIKVSRIILLAEQMEPCRMREIKWVHMISNTNMPNYFRSDANKVADKIANEISTNKIHNEKSDVFSSKA